MKVIQNVVWMMAGGIFLLGIITSVARAAENTTGTALTEDAERALSDAEFIVGMAKNKTALWTTAADALAKAQDAAKKHDSEAVTKHAAVASDQAFLGLAQSGYPLIGAD